MLDKFQQMTLGNILNLSGMSKDPDGSWALLVSRLSPCSHESSFVISFSAVIKNILIYFF